MKRKYTVYFIDIKAGELDCRCAIAIIEHEYSSNCYLKYLIQIGRVQIKATRVCLKTIACFEVAIFSFCLFLFAFS